MHHTVYVQLVERVVEVSVKHVTVSNNRCGHFSGAEGLQPCSVDEAVHCDDQKLPRLPSTV